MAADGSTSKGDAVPANKLGFWRSNLMPSRLRSAIPVSVVFIVTIILWEIATIALDIPAYILPSPSAIVADIFLNRALLLEHSLVTLWEVVLGFGLSILVGVPLGIAIVYSPRFERTVYPFLVASQAIPKVALAPIFVVWFGFGLLPKVLIAFLIAFFPIVVNTVVGMSRTPQEMIYLMRSLGASSAQIFLRVRMPSAAPYIFAGMKVAAAFAVVGAIVGEFIAANSGLGYLQLIANSNFQITLLFSTLVVLSLMGIALFYLVALVEVLVIPRPLRKTEAGEGGSTL